MTRSQRQAVAECTSLPHLPPVLQPLSQLSQNSTGLPGGLWVLPWSTGRSLAMPLLGELLGVAPDMPSRLHTAARSRPQSPSLDLEEPVALVPGPGAGGTVSPVKPLQVLMQRDPGVGGTVAPAVHRGRGLGNDGEV